MTTITACVRCGHTRQTKPERTSSGYCTDCRYVMSGPVEQEGWAERAACLGDTDDTKWFPNLQSPDAAQRAALAEAKATCAACPVTAECLNAALAEELNSQGRYGIRGALLPKERDEVARRRGHRRARAATGTYTPVPCHVCGTPTSPLAMARHIQRKHPDASIRDTRTSCPDCGISITPTSLARHIRRKHSDSDYREVS